jgi:hypothetical protein
VQPHAADITAACANEDLLVTSASEEYHRRPWTVLMSLQIPSTAAQQMGIAPSSQGAIMMVYNHCMVY